MSASNEWAARIEGATLVTADHHRESWTRDELEFVTTFTNDARDEEIAYALGRSLYAIWAIQYRIRNGEIEFTERTTPRVTQWDEGFDYVTTFPPGYRD